jgi:hypothetical protein
VDVVAMGHLPGRAEVEGAFSPFVRQAVLCIASARLEDRFCR